MATNEPNSNAGRVILIACIVMALGSGVGTALGVALGNIAIGVSMGSSMGFALGLVAGIFIVNQQDQTPSDDAED